MKIWDEIAGIERQFGVDDVWDALLGTLSNMGFDFAIYLTIDATGNGAFLRTNIPQIYDLIQLKEDPFFKH
jgi:hypothetical protein